MLFSWIVFPLLLAAAQQHTPTARPEFLTFDELISLSETDHPAPALAEKLDRVLKTPLRGDDDAREPIQPHRPSVDGIGTVLRVANWNIERGLNFDLIRLALSDPDGFKKAALERGAPDPDKLAKIEQQLLSLRDADVVILNEVDLGMKRTDYRDVARDLAHALGMHCVFGVEFVEVDLLDDLGLEKVALEDPDLTRQMQEDLKPDPTRYLGLHGNAILSRYPIQNARIIRLPVCYDWFNTEKAEISKLERGKRLAANKVFLERIEREVRQGGRMAIVADVDIPDLPTGRATIVNVHLENRCKPECRTRQMDALLSEVREVENPVIVAGDLKPRAAMAPRHRFAARS